MVLPVLPLFVLFAALLATHAIATGASERWRLLFRPLCHGIAERCLVVWGSAMPICSRCTAIYAGLFAGMVLFWLLPRVREAILRRAMFVAALPLAIDGVTQAVGLRLSNNPLRIGTGFLAAFVFGWWVITAIDTPVERADQHQ